MTTTDAIHRFDSMSLLLCEVQDTDDLEYREHKPRAKKAGFGGMTSGRVKNNDLVDYDDGAGPGPVLAGLQQARGVHGHDHQPCTAGTW